MDVPERILAALVAQPLFAGLMSEQLAPLARSARWERRDKGEFFRGEDQLLDRVYFVVRGRIQTLRSGPQGDEAMLGEFEAGEVFGLFLLNPRTHVRAGLRACMDDSVALSVSASALRETIEQCPEVALRAAEILSDEIEALYDRIEELTLCTVRQRLARQLLREMKGSGTPEIGAIHEDLAARIGTKQEEVTRGIRFFKNQGWTASKRHRHGLRLVDLESLEEYGQIDPDGEEPSEDE